MTVISQGTVEEVGDAATMRKRPRSRGIHFAAHSCRDELRGSEVPE
jgi:hypothetical protein